LQKRETFHDYIKISKKGEFFWKTPAIRNPEITYRSYVRIAEFFEKGYLLLKQTGRITAWNEHDYKTD
jgi:hypothetical protein